MTRLDVRLAASLAASAALALACPPPSAPDHDAGVDDDDDDAGVAGDAGVVPEPEPFFPCSLQPGGTQEGAHVLRFELRGATDELRVSIARRYVEFGVGESRIFAIDRMVVARGASCVDVDDAAALGYVNSHHNWDDEASATADGVRHVLSLAAVFIGERVSYREEDASSGAPLFEAADLVVTGMPVNCQSCTTSFPVLLSEVLLAPSPSSTFTDPQGEREPWLELRFPAFGVQDLEGWGLSDDPADPFLWTFPAGAVVADLGVSVVFLDGDVGAEGLHAGFSVDNGGAWLVLSMPDGTTVGERYFPPAAEDTSYVVDWSTGGFLVEPSPTPNQVNPTDPD